MITPVLSIRIIAYTIGLALLFLTTSTASGQATNRLPEPWNKISNLSDSQVAQIIELSAAAKKEELAIKARIVAERKNIHRKWRITDEGTAQCDIDRWVGRALEQNRMMHRRHVMPMLTEDQRLQLQAIPFVTELYSFKKFQQKQDTAVSCWAACLQMLLNFNTIQISQEEVIEEIKGRLIAEDAKPEEILKIRGWKLASNNLAKRWRADCEYRKGCPPASMVVRLIGNDRMILLNIQDKHMVVLCKVAYTGLDNQLLQSVVVYDPKTGEEKEMQWSEAEKKITGWWYAWAASSLSSVF